ncbi:UvrD-helicase domain-containing protein [Dyella jiangningensis]|uniref:UvrD-helicase domain-containing protein n=1 Tax=Dyella jiangningensis TaxID=1379159 RepID=UPI003CCD3C05
MPVATLTNISAKCTLDLGKTLGGCRHPPPMIEERSVSLLVVLLISRFTVAINRGIFWSELTLANENVAVATLDGIPNRFAIEFRDHAQQALASIRKREADQAKLRRLNEQLPHILQWSRSTTEEMNSLWVDRRWLAEEHIVRWKDTKPRIDLPLIDPVIAAHIAHRPAGERAGLDFWQRETRESAQEQNKKLVDQELLVCKDFFDHVEKTPLTEEQARAVLCFDNRVLVVASAGSGKTSTMVAKAGYACIESSLMLPKSSCLPSMQTPPMNSRPVYAIDSTR